MWLFALQKKLKGGSSPSTGTGPRAPPTMPSRLLSLPMTRMPMQKASMPAAKPSVSRTPPKLATPREKEMDETFKKLKEISK